MRIGVLPPRSEGTDSAIENYLALTAIKNLLGHHELIVLDGKTSPGCDAIVFIGNRFLTDGFWDEWILRGSTKIAVVGLAVDESLTWDARATEKLRRFAGSGGVSVVDEVSGKKVKEVLASSAVCVGGNIGLFVAESRLVLASPGTIFCPTTADPAFRGKAQATFRRLLRRFYRRINRKGRALFLVHSPAEFELGAAVGTTTLFEPDHPQIHLKAIASASGVVGFHPTALMASVGCGVPALLVGNDPVSKNAVESAGVPFLQINPNTDPAELHHRCEEILRKYPWETVREKTHRLRNTQLDYFKRAGIDAREPRRRQGPKVVAPAPDVLHLAHVLGREELAAFAGLFENLSAICEGEVHHHVLALDRITQALVQKTFPTQHVYLYRTGDVWPSRDVSALLSGAEGRRQLLKPRFLAMLAKKCPTPVLYCASSVFFYRPPTELLAALEGGHTLLFPRWADAIPTPPGPAPFDTSLLVVSKGSAPLLDWWADAALKTGEALPQSTLEEEPSFLGMAPVLFEGVRIHRAADEIAAPSNENALGVHAAVWPGEPLRLADDRIVRSLRWQSQTPPIAFGIKAVWDQLVHFFAGLPTLDPGDRLSRAVVHRLRAHWSDLHRFLWAQAWFNRHFPWLAGTPSPFWTRGFVGGFLRYPLRWAATAGKRLAPSRRKAVESAAATAWAGELRARIFAPLQPAASDAGEVSQPTSAARA